jgi:hypothetical protein
MVGRRKKNGDDAILDHRRGLAAFGDRLHVFAVIGNRASRSKTAERLNALQCHPRACRGEAEDDNSGKGAFGWFTELDHHERDETTLSDKPYCRAQLRFYRRCRGREIPFRECIGRLIAPPE